MVCYYKGEGQTYADVSYGAEDFIMFGKETAGIPEEILVSILLPVYGYLCLKMNVLLIFQIPFQ